MSMMSTGSSRERPFELKNRVVGFFNQNQVAQLIENFKNIAIQSDDIEVFSGQEAFDVVDPAGKHSGIIKHFQRVLQRTIGGGESEFMRDVQNIAQSKDKCMVSVHVYGKDRKNKVVEIMRQHSGERIKYFHPGYVEHETLESDHEQIYNVKLD